MFMLEECHVELMQLSGWQVTSPPDVSVPPPLAQEIIDKVVAQQQLVESYAHGILEALQGIGSTALWKHGFGSDAGAVERTISENLAKIQRQFHGHRKVAKESLHVLGFWWYELQTQAYQEAFQEWWQPINVLLLDKIQSLRAMPPLATNQVGREQNAAALTYTMAGLRLLTGLRNDAIGRYLRQAGLPTARRGQRNFSLSMEEAVCLLECIIGTSTEDRLVQKCRQSLDEILK